MSHPVLPERGISEQTLNPRPVQTVRGAGLQLLGQLPGAVGHRRSGGSGRVAALWLLLLLLLQA